jgi:hypothetical protein
MTRIALVLAALVPLATATQGPAEREPFRPALAVPLGARSGDIVLVDINRDKHLDLAVAHPPNGTLTVRFGNGTGRFNTRPDTSTALPHGGGAIALGDVNADSQLDLVVTSKDQQREYVDVLAGDGRGRFSIGAGSRYTVADAFAYYKPALRLLDVNEDGRLDIVYANGRRNTIQLLVSDRRGGFTPAPRVQLAGESDFYSFGLADVDSDGHLDVVSANSMGRNSDRVVVRKGNGTGTFADAAPVASTRPGARVATIGDLDGDRRLDIVLTHFENHRLSVLLNSAAGAFTDAPGSPFTLTHEAFGVVAADVNRDGKADLLVATVDSTSAPYNGRVTVLLHQGGRFAPAPGAPYRAGPGAYNIALGDVNEDGLLDVAASSFESEAMTLLLGQ